MVTLVYTSYVAREWKPQSLAVFAAFWDAVMDAVILVRDFKLRFALEMQQDDHSPPAFWGCKLKEENSWCPLLSGKTTGLTERLSRLGYGAAGVAHCGNDPRGGEQDCWGLHGYFHRYSKNEGLVKLTSSRASGGPFPKIFAVSPVVSLF